MWQSILSGTIQPSADALNTENWLISLPVVGRFFRFSWQSDSSIPQLWGQIAQIQSDGFYEFFQQQRWKLRESQEVFELTAPPCFAERRIALQVFNVERQALASPQIQVNVEVFEPPSALFETFIEEELSMAIQNVFNNALRSGVQFFLGGDAPGDTYFRSASGPVARLGIGSNGKILTVKTGLPSWEDAPTAVAWSEITGTSQAGAINSGYIASNAALCTISLPATAALGSVFEIVGKGAGGWKLSQAANQKVHFGNISSTTGTGGSLNSTHQRDAIRLVCVIADTDWQVVGSQGNIDVI